MGTKNRNRRIADFFCFTITLFVFCFPHTTLSCPSLSSKITTTLTTKTTFLSYSKNVVQSCPSLSSKKHDNKDNISISKKCCPRLSLVVVKKHDNIDNISILFQKCCPRLSLVVVKKYDNIDNKDNISILFQKVLSKVVSRCRQKNHLFMKIFIFVSENIKMFCLGNISLSLKSTIRFFLIRISPIQCVRERDGGLRSGSINDGLFHLLMLGNVWVKSLTNLVQCVTEQKMY